MTFNVENLFDARHDEGKLDHTFLPLSLKNTPAHRQACKRAKRQSWRDQCLTWDWSEKVLAIKLDRLARSIVRINAGRGPDLLVLQEVENIGILRRLRTRLGPRGYGEPILIEGHDRRGIDVAFVSRLALVGAAQLHEIPFSPGTRKRHGDTRGVLQATFALPDGRPLTAFAVHLPAPYHPQSMRAAALRFINRLRARLPARAMVVLAGDFNIAADEADKTGIVEQYASPHWLVAHQIGCHQCRGTTYYQPKRQWSFLDMIWLSENLGESAARPAPWRVIADSIAVANGTAWQVSASGTPARFDPAKALAGQPGLSDHWPLTVTLAQREAAAR